MEQSEIDQFRDEIKALTLHWMKIEMRKMLDEEIARATEEECLVLTYWDIALRIRPCGICGHDEFDHSRILPLAPCLDCACFSFVPKYRPNPSN